MAKVFALQGPWAVGKSTFVMNCLERRVSNKVYVGEFGVSSRKKRSERNLDISTKAGFLENQEIFFREAYETSRMFNEEGIEVAILDRGFEDVLCFSRIHLEALGVNWDIDQELSDLRSRYPFALSMRTAFLTAQLDTLFARRGGDKTKPREKFEQYMDKYYGLEVEYFRGDPTCVFFDTSSLSRDEVFAQLISYFDITQYFKPR